MKVQTKHGSKKTQSVWEELWLTYYNDALFRKGLITEDQRNKMRVRIKTRSYTAGK